MAPRTLTWWGRVATVTAAVATTAVATLDAAPASALAGRVAGAANGRAASAGTTGAGRCTAATFATAQGRLEQALSDRATRLSDLANRISAAGDGGSNTGTLAGIVDAEQHTVDGGGIAGLQATVSGETTCSQLAATAQAMVQDFRVEELVTPQVEVTLAADREAELVGRGSAAEATISARIAAAGQQGRDVTAAQQSFADYKQRLSSASSTLGGLSVLQLLAQVPTDYPGDRTLVRGDVAAAKQVVGDLRSARADLKAIRQDLS